MKNISYLIISLLIVGTLSSSCKKDDENDGPKLSQKEKNLAGTSSKTWKVTSIVGKSPDAPIPYNGATIDLFNGKMYVFGFEVPNTGIQSIPECVKDNLYVLYQDKTYEVQEGASKCVASAPNLVNKGIWKFNDSETVLTLTDSAGTNLVYNITELTEASIKGETSGETVYEGKTLNYTATTTFSAQ